MTVNTKWDLNAPIEGAPNFTLAELIHSDTADRYHIDNTPPAAIADTVYKNLTYLAQKVLQPVRDWAGEPVYISSGYRGPALNLKVKGSATSWHKQGCAVDIVRGSKSTKAYKEIFQYIAENLPFTELIAENLSTITSGSGWVHVAIVRGQEETKGIKYMLKYDGVVRRASLAEVLEKYDRWA